MAARWKEMPLRYISTEWCDGPFGSGLASEHYRESGARVVRLQNIREAEFAGGDEAYVDEEYFTTSLARHNVQEGDVLVAGLGDDNNFVGRACVAPKGLGLALVKADCFRFRLDPAKAEPRFVAYALSATAPQAAGELSGGSTRQRINLGNMASRKLLVPPLTEQVRIADFLDEQMTRINALIAEKQKLAACLKDIEEVTGFDLVTRGLRADVKRRSYSEPWLAEVPAHWSLSKLRQVARIGNGSTPKRDKNEYWKGGFTPWLNSGSVNSPRIQEASDFVTETAKRECHLPMVRPGSTVVALTGQGKTRGTAAVTELETTINQHLAYVSPFDPRLTDEFLWVALTGFYSVLRHLSEGEGSTKGALTCEQLNQFRLPLPPVEEQVLIVQAYKARTQTIEELLVHVREHIERLREYRSSLISAAVTGQLDVSSYERQPERLVA